MMTKLDLLSKDLSQFWQFISEYSYQRLRRVYSFFEHVKTSLVDALYKKRGKYARPFVHAGMVGLLFIGVTVGPAILEDSQSNQALSGQLPQARVLGLTTEDTFAMGTQTQSGQGVLEYRGGEVTEYEVQAGETTSEIAERFGLTVDTLLWANGLTAGDSIKEGQTLKILPIDGIMHKVKKGETVYSVAKKYAIDPQGIVDYPFNSFTNDETFALAVGQQLMVPDGVMPKAIPVSPNTYVASTLTPDAGVVSATGRFVWPASGRISQGYRSYHRAIDIANKAGGPILAADDGRVIIAGWPDNSGYGNRIIIDHGNGYQTLYAHLSRFNVVPGQSVSKGNVIGQMGSTGRSTGTHLHFEIRAAGQTQNPLNFLN